MGKKGKSNQWLGQNKRVYYGQEVWDHGMFDTGFILHDAQDEY